MPQEAAMLCSLPLPGGSRASLGRQQHKAAPCGVGCALCLGWEIYGRCSVSCVWPHTEQEQADIKCLEDLLIMLSFVILSLKLMRIKLYLHNKSEYDRGNVVKCQNVVSSWGRRSY